MKRSHSAKPPRRRAQHQRRRSLPGGIGIVHEDDDLIVVDKPCGLNTVTPPGQDAPNLFSAVKDHVRAKVRRRGTRAWIVHRLDKEASGLLVFARTERAFRKLKDAFRAKRVHRQYAAVVEGEFEHPAEADSSGMVAGTIRSFLHEDASGLVHSVKTPMEAPPPRARRGDEEDTGEVRLAVTHYRVLWSGQGRSLIQARLETGRKNQIRVHVAGAGHPIVGDRRYGAATDPIGRVCLHAVELGFEHPGTGRSVRFLSPMPGAFPALVGASEGVAELEPWPDQKAPDPADAPRDAPPSESWDHVAAWYDELLEGRKSDHHEQVIIPGALRLLCPRPGERVLDIACGQGLFCRRLAALGASVTGVDASLRLIDAARAADPGSLYLSGDARELGALGLNPGFDAVTCIMALMNIEPVGPVLSGAATLLRPGGRFVAVLLHPAFRSPGQTSWAWQGLPPPSASTPAAKKDHHKPRRTRRTPADGRAEERQFRRVDAYLSPARREIVMNPGAVSSGAEPVLTTTHHRPIGAYIRAFAGAGLLLDALEEWPSGRSSQPGPRAVEENRARREIPMFLALRGIRSEHGHRIE